MSPSATTGGGHPRPSGFPSAGVRGSQTSGSLPSRDKTAYAAELGVLVASRLTSSNSPRIPRSAAESSRRASGNYFSAGLPKNQFPLRYPPPLPDRRFPPPPGCRRLHSSWPTNVGHILAKPPAPASFASRAAHLGERRTWTSREQFDTPDCVYRPKIWDDKCKYGLKCIYRPIARDDKRTPDSIAKGFGLVSPERCNVGSLPVFNNLILQIYL